MFGLEQLLTAALDGNHTTLAINCNDGDIVSGNHTALSANCNDGDIVSGNHTALSANYNDVNGVHNNQPSLAWEWKGEKAGVFENAWDDLDTTPHVWTHTEPVDPSAIDNWIPYGAVASPKDLAAADAGHSGILAAAKMKAAYDGTCNPMPGFKPSFNPVNGGGCTLNPMYNQPGLGYGASYGSGTALAAPFATDGASPIETKASKAPALRPTCGHYLLATEACVYGAFEATMKVLQGEQSAVEDWTINFQKTSTAAADSCTPMGAWVLKNHVFKQAA